MNRFLKSTEILFRYRIFPNILNYYSYAFNLITYLIACFLSFKQNKHFKYICLTMKLFEEPRKFSMEIWFPLNFFWFSGQEPYEKKNLSNLTETGFPLKICGVLLQISSTNYLIKNNATKYFSLCLFKLNIFFLIWRLYDKYLNNK